MDSRTVLLRSEDERWLELTVGDDQAFARVGGPGGVGEPFPFSFENLGYVANGIGYQAWGDGSHFNLRREPRGIVIEFQSPHDLRTGIIRLSREVLRTTLTSLAGYAPIIGLVSVL